LRYDFLKMCVMKVVLLRAICLNVEKMLVVGSLNNSGDNVSIAITYWMLLSWHWSVQYDKLFSTATLLASNPSGSLKKSCLAQSVWSSSSGKSYWIWWTLKPLLEKWFNKLLNNGLPLELHESSIRIDFGLSFKIFFKTILFVE